MNMKKIKNNGSYLFWICLIVIAGLTVSCDDNNNSSNSGKVVLLSFGPSGVHLGDTISFIGNNLDKVTEIVFVGDSVAKSSFLTQTPDLIKVIVPPLVQRGNVTLRTTDGDVVSLTPIDFFVEMTLTGIETERPGWTTRPGSNITITGTNMNWVKQIDFYNKTNVIAIKDTFFVSQSPTQIVVTVPLAAQTGQLALYVAGTKATKIVVQDNLNIVLPEITDMSPNPVFGGKDQLTITGTDLDLVTGIMLANVPDTIKTFVSQTATQIVIAPPANTAPGVVTLYPYSLVPCPSTGVLNVVLPAITGISPNPVDRGSQLTVTGTNLDLVTGVMLKGVTDTIKTFVSQSATKIVITVPKEASFGPVTVFSLAGVPIASDDALAYVGDPVQLPPLGLALYENGAYQNGLSYGWWLSTTPDPKSTDVVNIGTPASLKMTFDGGWSGAFYQGINLSLSSYSKFEFSAYGGKGTDGKQILISFNSNGDVQNSYTIAEGKWTNFSVPITAWSSLAGSVTALQIQDSNWAGVVYFDRIGFVK